MNFDDFTLDDHIDAAYKLGAKHERAKIVAWLRDAGYRQIADAIDVKEYLK